LLLLYFKSYLKELFFSFYGAALCPFWCVSQDRGFSQTHPAPLREEKEPKKKEYGK
jgi:hypothetical protein